MTMWPEFTKANYHFACNGNIISPIGTGSESSSHQNAFSEVCYLHEAMSMSFLFYINHQPLFLSIQNGGVTLKIGILTFTSRDTRPFAVSVRMLDGQDTQFCVLHAKACRAVSFFYGNMMDDAHFDCVGHMILIRGIFWFLFFSDLLGFSPGQYVQSWWAIRCGRSVRCSDGLSWFIPDACSIYLVFLRACQ